MNLQPISFWLVFSDKDRRYLKNIIDDLGLKYNASLFIPHLTIYSGENIEPKIVQDVIRKSVNGIKPFEIVADRINYTDSFFKTIFIEFKRNKSLDMIYKRLSKKLSKFGKYEFNPHASLIYKELSENKKIAIIKKLVIKNEFTVSGVMVVVPGNTEKGWYDVKNWRVVDKSKFSSK